MLVTCYSCTYYHSLRLHWALEVSYIQGVDISDIYNRVEEGICVGVMLVTVNGYSRIITNFTIFSDAYNFP